MTYVKKNMKDLTELKSLLYLVTGTRQSPVEGKLVKDGKVLPLKDVEVVVLDDRIDFKYKKPARELSGNYQIKISNAQGEDVRNVKIVFQGEHNKKYRAYGINYLIAGCSNNVLHLCVF